MEMINSLKDSAVYFYGAIKSVIPVNYILAFDTILLAILIVVVAMFIWRFYNSLSQRNLFVLNLNKYNQTKHRVLKKVLAVLFYFLEYLLIMPFIILLWFSGLALILMLISEQAAIGKVLLISAAMVISIRVLAYHNDEISTDLAKMFPFIALSLFLLSPEAFDFAGVLEQVGKLPLLFSQIILFLVVIYIVEIFFRLLYTLKELAWDEED